MRRMPSWPFWVITILVATIFVLTGFSKLAGEPAAHWAERFSKWRYPPFFRVLIGALEILCGLAVLVKQSRRAAAVALMVIMAGAFCTHLVHDEFVRLISPTLLGGLALVLYLQDR
jgi:uncharacterized membrane protein YphA (DoxX/SURF4 family)